MNPRVFGVSFGLGLFATVGTLAILANAPGIPCMQGNTCVLDKLSVRNPQGGNTVTTTGGNPLKLFVDNNGNDNNSCLSATSACATMQAAELKIPKYINGPVEVSVDAGNFACSTWDGFTFTSDADAGSFGSLWVHGTPAIATSAADGGLTIGTVASATDITDIPGVLPTVTVTGAGWTTNALRGTLFNVTGGTGSGETLMISSNTATVLTLAGAYKTSTGFWPTPGIITQTCTPFAEYTLPDNTSTFQLLQNATHINTHCAIPGGPNPSGLMGTYTNQAHDTFGIYVAGMRGDNNQGAYTLGGNDVYGVCSPQATVAFTNFDFNDPGIMGANFYTANSDAVQYRWNTFQTGYNNAFGWQHVGRMSLFSNALTNGNTCFYGFDAYAGDTALIIGNVDGAADNSGGCWQYDGMSINNGPRIFYSGLNNIKVSGTRSVLNITGTQIFSEFDDSLSNYTTVGMVIGSSSTSSNLATSIGTSVFITSDEFEGHSGAVAGIVVEPNNYLYLSATSGDGGTFGTKIIGPAVAQWTSQLGAPTLGGTTGQICQDLSCTSAVKYTDMGVDKNVQYSSIGGGHKFTTAATSVPGTVGCADTAETVPGALVDVPCSVSPHSAATSAGGYTATCFASAAGTIQLHLCCVSATCTANSVTWTLEQQN